MTLLVSGDFDEIARAARKFLAVYDTTSSAVFIRPYDDDIEDLNYLTKRLQETIEKCYEYQATNSGNNSSGSSDT